MGQQLPTKIGVLDQPLRQQVHEAVRARIVDGTLVPGQRIIERHLADELGVSRLPIREALRMLEREGFVSVLPRRGVVVRQLTRADIEELFDVREALEVLAVRRATERATDAELRRLERTLQAAETANQQRRRSKEIEHRERFHDEIVALAHNTLLAGLLEPLQDRLHWLFRQTDDADALLREHRALYEAIATRDAQVAADEALAHVRRNRERLLSSSLIRPASSGPATAIDAGKSSDRVS